MSDHAGTGDSAMSDHKARREGDRRRAAKLRERRSEEGQTRISAWVPRERASYARQVLQAAAAGANALPPDPEQAAALDTAQVEAAAARAAEGAALAKLTEAEQHVHELTAELAAAHTATKTMKQAWEGVTGELHVAQAVATQAQAKAERFQQMPGLRGRVVRWLVK
jgi:chromosome segregation ATPase